MIYLENELNSLSSEILWKICIQNYLKVYISWKLSFSEFGFNINEYIAFLYILINFPIMLLFFNYE